MNSSYSEVSSEQSTTPKQRKSVRFQANLIQESFAEQQLQQQQQQQQQQPEVEIQRENAILPIENIPKQEFLVETIETIETEEIDNEANNKPLEETIFSEPPENLIPLFEHAEIFASIDNGYYMKTKTGTSGPTPAEDSFPWFSSSQIIYIHFLWDLLPSEWRLVSFLERPYNPYDPDEYLKGKQILISDIDELLLENDEQHSIRIYLHHTKQVVRLTPVDGSEAVSKLWINAIYSAMELQALEGSFDESEGEEEGDGEAGVKEGQKETHSSDIIETQDIELGDHHHNTHMDETYGYLLDLRDLYYQYYPTRKPMLRERKEDQALVIRDDIEAGKHTTTLGAESRPTSQRSSKRFSLNLDYNLIYNNSDNKSTDDQQGVDQKQCCILS